MGVRRLEYLTAVLAAFWYYLMSGEWVSMILLVSVLLLPLLSLLISLPAMLTVSIGIEPEGEPVMGQKLTLWLAESGKLPCPAVRGRLRPRSCFGQKQKVLENGSALPTDHCGGWILQAEKVRICDYLGLITLPVRKTPPCRIPVRPLPVPLPETVRGGLKEPDSWVPKPGGGFSENYEHRAYRPGDNMNQIHWKLTEKMGDYIVREAMQPVRGSMALSLSLTGSPEELDRKLGRLLWTGGRILELGLDVQLRAYTASGVLELAAADAEGLTRMVDTLLFETPADREPPQWREDGSLYLGGDADEG